jgi:hypothetical protein
MTAQNCSRRDAEATRCTHSRPETNVLLELSNVCELLVMVATASMLPRKTESVTSSPTEQPRISGS